MKRLALGSAVSAGIVLLPALGSPAALHAPHVWILLVLGVLASMLQPFYNPLTIAASAGDRGTGAQIIWSVYITQIGAVVEAVYLRYPRSVRWDVAAVVGLAGAIMGLALRTWAVRTLGRSFTMHVAVGEGQTVVRGGPYRLVRHPGYLGALALYLSTIVFLHAWSALLLALFLLPWAFVRRIMHEESVLMRELGDEYAAYSAGVSRMLPGVW